MSEKMADFSTLMKSFFTSLSFFPYSCLGKCSVGQLGHGKEDEDSPFPKRIESLKDSSIVKIGCGISHILLIDGIELTTSIFDEE